MPVKENKAKLQYGGRKNNMVLYGILLGRHICLKASDLYI